jgi:hypothetical protein
MKRGVLLLCMISIAALAQAPTAPKREAHPPSTASAENQAEAQTLSNDVARMRVLLHQMEMNLALVQTTQTPLKHQFELEIDMWRVVLEGMERRAQALGAKQTGGVVPPGTVPLQQGSRQGKP